MSLSIGNLISISKTFLANISSVTKELILAMDNLVAWVVDSETDYTTQSIDITGDASRTAASGRCYSFDGTDDLLMVLGGGAMTLGTSNFSLAFRFLIDGSATGDNCIISDSTTTTSQFLGYNATTNNFTVQLNGTTFNLPYTLTADTWYHIVVNYARGGNARLYVNAIGNTPVSISSESAYSLTKAMFIGNASFGGTNVLLGKINDFRIYDSTLSQPEITALEDYSAEPDNTLLLQYKCEEESSIYVMDSSGNERHGVAAFTGPSTFMLADNNILNSYTNNFGYSDFVGYNSNNAYSEKTYDATLADVREIEFRIMNFYNSGSVYLVSKAPSGGVVNSIVYETNSGTKLSYFDVSGTRVVTTSVSNAEIHTYKVTFAGTAVELFVDGVSVDTGTASSSNPFDSAENVLVGGGAVSRYSLGAWFSLTLRNSLGATVLVQDGLTHNNVWEGKAPRDESDVLNDVSGSALEHTGKPRYNFDLVKSNCISFYVDSENITVPDIGAITEFSCMVKFVDDNQQIIEMSASPLKTNISVNSNVMVYGADVTNPVWTIDGVVKTDSEAGVLLNDNEWHLFHASFDSLTADGIFFGSSGGSPGEVHFYDFNFGDGTAVLPCSEGAGLTCYDISGNNYHGTHNGMNSTNWANTQDAYHYNILNSFELYTDDATELIKIRVPYKSDASKITPTITDYTKQTENLAGEWHNDAETKLNATSAPAIFLANQNEGNDFLFTSGTVNDLDYSDFDDDINNTSFFFSDISVANRRKNLLIFSAEKTGADLANIQEYLNH